MKILHRGLLYDNNCNFFRVFLTRNKHGKQETNKHFLSNNRNCRRRTTYRNLVKNLFWRIFSASNKGRTVRNFKVNGAFRLRFLALEENFSRSEEEFFCAYYILYIDIYKYSSRETVSFTYLSLSCSPTFSNMLNSTGIFKSPQSL